MRIRALTCGLSLDSNDFISYEHLYQKFSPLNDFLNQLQQKLMNENYEIQTIRFTLNSFEHWIPFQNNNTSIDLEIGISRIQMILKILDNLNIQFCSIGSASTKETIQILPIFLSLSSKLYSNALIQHSSPHSSASSSTPPLVYSSELALVAAQVAVDLSKQTSDGLKNFSYCVSFNCPPNIPFFPASYHRHLSPPILSVALECGELLFLAFHGLTEEGAKGQGGVRGGRASGAGDDDHVETSRPCVKGIDHEQATQNLNLAYQQMLTPIQEIIQSHCETHECQVIYGGIDASMNPALSLVESVGKGMEELIPSHHFGQWGTLSVVSVITKAIKTLPSSYILCGYNGLMLPVMEDIQLSARAAEISSLPLSSPVSLTRSSSSSSSAPVVSPYTLRDLLIYSSVCGVGLDTVPIPGNTSPEQLRDIYSDIATLASRLNKPLSCRLLLMPGLSAGEMTNVESPYLCNTRVFSI
jgi:uncharacterized protein